MVPIRLPGPMPEHPHDPIRPELTAHGAVVVYGRVSDWTPLPTPAAELRRQLGRDWHRYLALEHPGVRDRFAASRLLLRHTAAAALDTTPDAVELAYQPGGRPYLRGCDQIEVGLSHTTDLLVVGVNRRGRIGVDIERVDRVIAGTAAEARALTPYERGQLAPSTGADRNAALVRLWTLKEAYSKALGLGMRFRFDQFGFDVAGDEAQLVAPDGTPVPAERWSFHTWLIVADRYVISGALHLTGLGESPDIAARTTLDQGLLDALLRAGVG